MEETTLLNSYLVRVHRQIKALKQDFKSKKRKSKIKTYQDLQEEFLFDILGYVEDILWFSKSNLEGLLNKANYHNLIPNIRILLEIYLQVLYLKYEKKDTLAQFFLDNKKLIFLLNYVNKTRVNEYPPESIERDFAKTYQNIINEFGLKIDKTLTIKNIDDYKTFGSKLFTSKKSINKFIRDPQKKNWINSSYIQFSEYEHARPSARLYFIPLRKRVFYAYLIIYSLWIVEEIIKNKTIDIKENRIRSYEDLYEKMKRDGLLKKLESISMPAY